MLFAQLCHCQAEQRNLIKGLVETQCLMELVEHRVIRAWRWMNELCPGSVLNSFIICAPCLENYPLLQFLPWHCRSICESWYPILHRTCLCYLNPRPSPLYLCLCDTLCPKSPVPISLWASGPGAVRSPLSPVPFMRNRKEYTTLCPLCIVREGIHMWLHKWVRLVGRTFVSRARDWWLVFMWKNDEILISLISTFCQERLWQPRSSWGFQLWCCAQRNLVWLCDSRKLMSPTEASQLYVDSSPVVLYRCYKTDWQFSFVSGLFSISLANSENMHGA